jgi:hypothetical protein
MKPLTINDINPKSEEFYEFKNFIGIQKPMDKSELLKSLKEMVEILTKTISLEEIIAEVKIVRAERYEKLKTKN